MWRFHLLARWDGQQVWYNLPFADSEEAKRNIGRSLDYIQTQRIPHHTSNLDNAVGCSNRKPKS